MSLSAAFTMSVVLISVLFASVYKIDAITKSHRHVDKVFLYLQWFDQAQFAGFYTADGKHFYDDVDIDVEIIPRPSDLKGFYEGAAAKGRSTMPNLTDLHGEWNVPKIVSASSDLEKPTAYGIWTGDQVLSQYKQDNLNIRAIGAVFNRSLACFMVRDDSDIFSPKDFGGKQVGLYRGYDTEIIYNYLIAQYPPALPPKLFYLDPSKDEGLKLLAAKKIAVLPVYAINEPLQASTGKAAFKYRLINPDYYNIDYYSDTLIANATTLANNPDLAKRFLEASERGWRWAFDHPGEAVSFVIANNPGLKDKAKEQELMLNRASLYVRTSNPMFAMRPENWEFMSHVLSQQGKISQDDGCAKLCDYDIAGAAHEKLHLYGRE